MSRDRWIVADLGGTTTRVAVFDGGASALPNCALPNSALSNSALSNSALTGTLRFPTPPADRDHHLDLVAAAVERLRAAHPDGVRDAVGVAVGATIDAEGRVRNAGMLWRAPHTGLDLRAALRDRLPWARVELSNDIAAAAWRYRALGRFALVTISTGVAIKVFDDALPFEAKLVQDPDGLGGEIGHVPVHTHAIRDADIRRLARSAAAGDAAAREALDARGVAWCECGNADDLCSHASGPAAVRAAARLALARSRLWSGSLLRRISADDPAGLTTGHIAAAAGRGDPFTLMVLRTVTRPLALSLLQLSAQLGLRRFVVMGGFAHGVGEPWFAALRENLRALRPTGAWFTGWSDEDVAALAAPSLDVDDSLVGMGALVRARDSRVGELHKPVGERRALVRHLNRPACGREQILARVAFASICGTDLQILRGDRGCEPGVLGHECVARIDEVGADVAAPVAAPEAAVPGTVVAVNPNHPLDAHDKLGHNIPGVLREIAVWDGRLADRGQLIPLPARGASEWALLEPLACAVRSLRGAGRPLEGRTVMVVGSGVAGLLHVLLARHWGARRTLLAHRGTGQLNLALERAVLRAEDCLALPRDPASASGTVSDVLDATGGSGVDALVLATSGTAGPQILDSLWDCVADGATVHLFGGFAPQALVRAPDGSLLPNRPIRDGAVRPAVGLRRGGGCTLTGSRGATTDDFALARDVCVSESGGTLDLSPLISHVVSLDAAPRVLAELAATRTVGGGAALRVVVDLRLAGDVVRAVDGNTPALAAVADGPVLSGARS